MKKYILSVIIVSTLSLVSCSKDDEPNKDDNYQTENFLNAYLTKTGFNENVRETGGGFYEFGLHFKSLNKGKIQKIRIKIPEVNNALRVTLWDSNEQNVYWEQVFDINQANQEFVFDIMDISLEKNKEYAISMNNNKWYEWSKNNSGTVTYPFVVGNIEIQNYGYSGVGTSQSFPIAQMPTDYYAGDLSFDFIRIE
ncbi:hypothetical protein [Flavobacterium sp.]|uniref:hypothetical protein n=1 Tax=Flavobacterium sp. TaxID=239 RepID=UPI004047AB0D